MRYFDLHCDTMYELCRSGGELAENTLHIDLRKAEGLRSYVQFFAVYTPPELAGRAADLHAQAVLGAMRRCLEAERGRMEFLQPGKGPCAFPAEGRAALLSMENAAPLEPDPERLLDAWCSEGLCLLSLTHNGENAFAEGALGDPRRGLTRAGRQLVRLAEQRGVMLDVSHLSDRAFYDLADCAGRPFIASHSNSRTVCPNVRNLTDDMFDEIVRRGGIVGINLHAPFVAENGADIDGVIRHIDHFLTRGGEDSLCMGADLDGTDTLTGGIKNITDVQKIADRMLDLGYNKSIVEKLFWQNACRFVKNFYRWEEKEDEV